MRGSKTRRVSWATDADLCQVRLFLNDEAPSQVGLGIQDHLQAKTSLHLHVTASEDNLPPGFEGVQPTNLSNNSVLEVPTIRWKRPPKLTVDLTWLVAAGEESREIEAENRRGLRVLEAIYPRPSSIPPNAVISVDVMESRNDHQQPPLIPITPIEEEGNVDDSPYEYDPMPAKQIGSQGQVAASGGFSTPVYVGNNSASTSSTDRLVSVAALGVEPGLLAAASAACTAIMKTDEQGNLIDNELLVQILSDHNLVQKLVNGYGANNLHSPPQNYPPVNLSNPPSVQNSQPELSKPAAVPLSSSNGPFYSQPNKMSYSTVQGPTSLPTPPSKDFNYYKSLIKQHGEGRQEVPQQFGPRPNPQHGMNQDHQRNNPHYRDFSKPKILKPCMFFNTTRGCKHGANCSFQHDTSYQQRASSMPDAKRMKMDREIPGV